MATRTITKTKTKVKTQDVEARTTTTSYGLDDAELRMDLDGSSSSQSDDDFGKDTLADIELHKQELAEIAANGGKKPRKKQKRTEGDVQTARTRKLVRNGRPVSAIHELSDEPLMPQDKQERRRRANGPYENAGSIP